MLCPMNIQEPYSAWSHQSLEQYLWAFVLHLYVVPLLARHVLKYFFALHSFTSNVIGVLYFPRAGYTCIGETQTQRNCHRELHPFARTLSGFKHDPIASGPTIEANFLELHTSSEEKYWALSVLTTVLFYRLWERHFQNSFQWSPPSGSHGHV